MQSSPDFLKNLNTAQTKAVTHTDGPLLIVAGAGTGKTTVVTRRIAWLIGQGHAKPEEILALTFTDKAAGEMEERVDKLLPIGYVNTWISTFHAFGERILKDYALEIGLPNEFRLLSGAQQWMLIRNNLERFTLNYYRPLGNPTRFIHALLQHFSRAKDEEVTPEDYLAYVKGLTLNADTNPNVISTKRLEGARGEISHDASEENSDLPRLQEVAAAYHVYQQLLLENSAFDFGDLINYALKLLRTRPRVLRELQSRFKYILVDEFQDTNYAQYELVKLLAAPGNNITVVGDDDQAVYKFRGASISNILEFKRDYPNCAEVFLNQNYRSFQGILDTAYTFIQQNNPYRLEVTLKAKGKAGLSKKLLADRPGKAEITYLSFETGNDEAEGVVKKILELRTRDNAPWSDFAILVRANSSAPSFLQALARYKIPFDYVANRGLYTTSIILEVVNYMRVLDSFHDSDALYRVLTREPFALPHDDIVLLAAHAKKKTTPLYGALISSEPLAKISAEGAVTLKKFLAALSEHAAYARAHTAAETYVKIVHDLGIEERVAHPALAQDAQYLASFYRTITQFELEREDKRMHEFLAYLGLELESGEEGRLPTNTDEGPDTVKVITVHSAKGLEWRYVFLVQLIDRRFPSVERKEPIELPVALIKETLPEGDVHLQEERRLFYVALTRARDGLYLTRADDYSGKTTRRPSRFLIELGLIQDTPPLGVRGGRGALRAAAHNEIAPRAPSHYPMPDSFSFSSVSAFRKCPLEYKFRYLLKLPGPGAAQLSFGVTIHKALEEFLKLWKSRLHATQGDLFAQSKSGKIVLPTFEELKAFYERAWIDDWYDNAKQKEEYRTRRGPSQLKNFYDNFVASPPRPKYLEEFFKINMGPYKFVGKIDRIDESTPNSSPSDGRGQGEGVTIIDYKTGEATPKKLEKVDKDQLIIYQIAAQDFLKEKVVNAMYWHLQPNHFSDPFVATQKQMDGLKEEYTETIDTIVHTIEDDAFIAADADAPRHDCKFEHLA